MISGASLPIHALVHAIYFTVRAGGRTIVTFLFDSVYTWAIPAMIALFLCRFTAMPIVWIFFIVQFSDIIKLAIGLPMLKPSFWTRCVITDVTTKKE
jgi:Na+-driven multidrug efflux pump